MANWDDPKLEALYSDFLLYLKARDIDTATLFTTDPVNPPVGAIRYVRASNKFQEWNGTAWVDKIISVAGGGTGSNTPAGAGSALGLGTMSTQNANSVAISGGTISGLNSLQSNGEINSSSHVRAAVDVTAGQNLGVSGTAYVGAIQCAAGANFAGVGLVAANGKIPAINSNYFNNLDGSQLTGIISFVAGMVMPFAGPSPPAGWFICDGAAVSRTTYAALFAAIGGYYGVGDGSTTFNVPNLQGRMPIGYGAGAGLTFRGFGEVGGAEVVALTTPQLPSHYHNINDVAHTHQTWSQYDDGGIGQNAIRYGGAAGGIYRSVNERGTLLTEPSGSGITATVGAGGDQAHNNMQPYIAMYYIIKA